MGDGFDQREETRVSGVERLFRRGSRGPRLFAKLGLLADFVRKCLFGFQVDRDFIVSLFPYRARSY